MSAIPAHRLSRDEVKALEKFKKAGYRIIGRHSAVKVCHWTKTALRDGKFCYKRWYGIRSHRCVQMTPTLQYCNMMCVFCWRFHSINRASPYAGDWDEPKIILDGCIAAQRELLSGFKGNPRVTLQRFNEAMDPRHIAISLDGEPMLYPYLSDLIKEAKLRGMTTFLVTNGTMPDRLEELDVLPTNLYISLYGPDETTHKHVTRPLITDSWQRILKSLELMSTFSCRRVVRLTLVKGYTMKEAEKYADLIKIATPEFVECKAYMHVGESQKRLPRDAMPSMEEVAAFAEELRKFLNYVLITEDPDSRVVLLIRTDVELSKIETL
ncbi:MAG: 4-demethylwyosine synthase TYW1 [Nitrososphaerota archaeon]